MASPSSSGAPHPARPSRNCWAAVHSDGPCPHPGRPPPAGDVTEVLDSTEDGHPPEGDGPSGDGRQCAAGRAGDRAGPGARTRSTDVADEALRRREPGIREPATSDSLGPAAPLTPAERLVAERRDVARPPGRGLAASHQALLLRLQQTGGNRTVQRLLQRAASGAAPRSPAAPSIGAVGTTDEDYLAARLRSAPGGEALPPGVRQQLEHGLGADLSRVRVHTDAEADRLARAVDATAFTAGTDIFFRARTYDPGSAEGMHLLAHEATHTVQQAAGPVAGRPAGGGVAISDPGDPFEQEANQAASRAMATVQVSAQSGADPGHRTASSAAARSPAFIQRGPGGATPRPRAPTFDEIAQALGPSLGGPYAAFAAFARSHIRRVRRVRRRRVRRDDGVW